MEQEVLICLVWFLGFFLIIASGLLPVTSDIVHQAPSAGLYPLKTRLVLNAWIFFFKSSVFGD